MTHTVSEDTDQPTEPTRRLTTAEAARLAADAQTTAAEVSDRLDDLAASVTDISTRLADLGSQPLPDAPDRDQVDARIHDALAPLHDEMHQLRTVGTITPTDRSVIGNLVARLEAAEKKLVAVDPGQLVESVSRGLHETISGLRSRMSRIEEGVKESSRPTLAFEVGELVGSLAAEISDLSQKVEALQRVEQNHVEQQSATLLPRPTGGLGAVKKVLALMRSVDHLGKDSTADLGQGGKFKFRSIDDAMSTVGHAMREIGLVLSPTILSRETTQNPVTKSGVGSNGKPYENTVIWSTTCLEVEYTFTDPDDGSTHSFTMAGEGRDASDKSTSKATSMALKYGLLQGLMIPTSEMEDGDAAPPQEMVQQHESASVAAQPVAPERTDREKAERAGQALQALRHLDKLDGGIQAQIARLNAIGSQVAAEGLLDHEVEGSTLQQHALAIRSTLQGNVRSDEPAPHDDGYGI